MSVSLQPIGEEELHAFIDGELDQDRAAEIERRMASDPSLAERIAAFRADKLMFERVYGALKVGPLPDEWVQRIDRGYRQRHQLFLGGYLSRQVITAVAATLLLFLGAWLVSTRVAQPAEETIVTEALAARQDGMHPQTSVDAAALGVPEARNGVVSMALALNVKAPDLTKMGYRLTAIRVYSGVPGGKAVELIYSGAQNRLFTLYLRHPSSAPRVDLVQRDGIRICIWQDDVIGTVMAGEMSAGEMARLASLAYSGLYL